MVAIPWYSSTVLVHEVLQGAGSTEGGTEGQAGRPLGPSQRSTAVTPCRSDRSPRRPSSRARGRWTSSCPSPRRRASTCADRPPPGRCVVPPVWLDARTARTQ
eukprot:436410-Prymnesium_polylepis.1